MKESEKEKGKGKRQIKRKKEIKGKLLLGLCSFWAIYFTETEINGTRITELIHLAKCKSGGAIELELELIQTHMAGSRYIIPARSLSLSHGDYKGSL